MKTYAKKRFGQHFLRDRGILDRIVRLIAPRGTDVVVEIGAGQGALSTRLAPAAGRLLAIEIDTDCLGALETALKPFESAQIYQADILEVDLAGLIAPHLHPQSTLRFAGNLPFNISTVIIEKVLESSLPVRDMTLMVQLEVGERIAAAPGSRDYGYLSIFCQHRADVRVEFKVSPACFVPRPKVTSAIVTMRPKDLVLDPKFEQQFKAFVKAAFGHRRKTLANSLKGHPQIGPVAGQLLSVAGIDGAHLRPEQLSVADYEHLTRTLQQIPETKL